MNEDELKTHFTKIFETLKTGGKFFLRTAGPKITPNTSTEKIKNWGEKENEFILSEKYIENGFRYENCIVINISNNEIVEYREKQRAFSLDDEIEVLRSAGFRDIMCYQDLNGVEATEEKFGIYCCIKQ
jgi:hypothetical protein